MSIFLDPVFDPDELKHDQWPKHDVRVEPDSIFEKDDAYRAVCSCGWKGPGCMYQQDAEAGVRAHLKDVKA